LPAAFKPFTAAIPTATMFNEIWCSQTKIAVTDAIETFHHLKSANVVLIGAEVSLGTNSDLEFDRQFLICDPDGHTIRLVDRQ
jgi:uncharacterized protein YcbX